MLDQPMENAQHHSSVWSVSCCFDPFLLKRASSSEGVVHQWPYHVPVNTHLCMYRNANTHSEDRGFFLSFFFFCFKKYLCITCNLFLQSASYESLYVMYMVVVVTMLLAMYLI